LTGGFSLALLISGAMAYPVGAWVDKHGSRLLMTVGSILASLLVIAWSQVSDLTSFYLIWAGLEPVQRRSCMSQLSPSLQCGL
jgi:MFS family permease